MTMIDHLSLGVSDIEKGCSFYNGLMTILGCDLLAQTEGFAAYGNGAPQFLIMLPSDGDNWSAGNGTHIAFVAKEKSAVDAAHRYAMEAGAKDNGAPGPREAYPKADVYTAFVIDPFGNKLEFIHNGFAA
ncbi:MAG: VOC family protein [Sneathiellales bacterium]|nr:VOC family protein [Sneathiellales bacterium]